MFCKVEGNLHPGQSQKCWCEVVQSDVCHIVTQLLTAKQDLIWEPIQKYPAVDEDAFLAE